MVTSDLPPAARLSPGSLVGDRYEVLRELGRGGMAATYLVHDHLRGDQVALKLLHNCAPALAEAMRTEFSLLRELYHPHLCQVHEFASFGHAEGEAVYFYTAAHVHGVTLKRYADGRRWEQLKAPIRDAIGALQLLHRAGIVHGDFKPDNVLVDQQGRGVLIDLGCARPSGSRLVGQISGTPQYLAPELLAGEGGDPRADLYAIGVSLRVLAAELDGPLPDPMQRLIERLTRNDPRERPAEANEVLEALGGEPLALSPIPSGLGRLVGREDALRAALEAWEVVRQARPAVRLVWVSGPDGIGKTRLLQELRWKLHRRCRVLEANAVAPRAIAQLLSAAIDEPLAGGDVTVALHARDVLSQRAGAPLVLLVDDAHLLGEEQRTLLAGFARCLEDTDPVLLVVADGSHDQPPRTEALQVALEPLGAADVRRWLGTGWSELADELTRLSGGHPGALRSLVMQFATGRLSEAQLRRCEAQTALSEWVQAQLSTLPDAAQWALGVLAAADQPVPLGALPSLGIERRAISVAQQLGMVRLDATGLRLVRPAEGQDLLRTLGVELTRRAHGRLGQWLARQLEADLPPEPWGSGAGDAATAARCAYHLVRAGELDAAKQLLLSHTPQHDRFPHTWARAACQLADSLPQPALVLLAARLEQGSGQPHAARARLEALLKTQLDPHRAVRIRRELGACCLKLGAGRVAVEQLQCALRDCADRAERARVADLLAQALCKQGDYARALQVADQAEHDCESVVLKADLKEAAGVALGYLGRLDEARQRLDSAAATPNRIQPPRHSLRSLGARALVGYQMGDLEAAATHYARALQLAERYALADQVALAALNYGTVCHQRGQWADAIASYERGMRMAVATGQIGTEAHLRFNLAKLYADVGLTARAERCLERCQQVARTAELPSVQAAAETVRGELALARGDAAVAQQAFEWARHQFQRSRSARECAEVELHLAELMLQQGATEQAGLYLRAAETGLGEVAAKDVAARLNLIRAKHLVASGLAAQGVELAAQAARSARELSQADLEGEAELVQAQAWAAQGSDLLSRKHSGAAREVWERCAMQLPPALREAFWGQFRRRAAAEPQPAAPLVQASSREHKLQLLVEIFRRLNSSLKTEEVLERAMDAAIELSGAERGFVLLGRPSRDRSQVRVAVARNLDREQLGRSHLKFSRAIAEQVMASGEPVVTASAQTDDRFRGQESVHAMHLQSVVCVPVHSPAGLLGALYLDNRFQAGRFSSQDVDLLLAFADQVAIALNNARLHHELHRRNRALARERRRVEGLLRDREAEVVRLSEQVEQRRPQSARRHDFGQIVGSSRAMQQLFAVLDRVIETDLPILISGESGTGKELVARAIHDNHPSRGGPLVSINCAALPEALLESELFGYERGAFTGADRSRAGLLVQARGGTLLLDELGDMPLSMQVKLLRVLQEREVRPLGSRQTVPIDIRLVCATNRNLEHAVRQGTFRKDLYYRVSGVEVRVPPLRERTEDIPELVHHLLVRATRQMGRELPDISRSALRKLTAYSWPGNVRQLENVLMRALVLADPGGIAAADIELPEDLALPVHPMDRQTYAEHEAEVIAQALAANNWNVAKVARLLCISRPTLYRRLRRYGLGRQARGGAFCQQ